MYFNFDISIAKVRKIKLTFTAATCRQFAAKIYDNFSSINGC